MGAAASAPQSLRPCAYPPQGCGDLKQSSPLEIACLSHCTEQSLQASGTTTDRGQRAQPPAPPLADNGLRMSQTNTANNPDTPLRVLTSWFQACAYLIPEHSNVREIRNGPSERAARLVVKRRGRLTAARGCLRGTDIRRLRRAGSGIGSPTRMHRAAKKQTEMIALTNASQAQPENSSTTQGPNRAAAPSSVPSLLTSRRGDFFDLGRASSGYAPHRPVRSQERLLGRPRGEARVDHGTSSPRSRVAERCTGVLTPASEAC